MRAKILNASAGAGKTYQLAYHYIRDVVDQPTIYRHILAVTFTNKATEEMKSRILKEIHALAEGQESSYLTLLSNDLGLSEAQIRQRAAEARSRILHDYSRFTVLTIDTFFQRILRAFIKELNLDLNYNIELETASLLTQGADQLIERITSNKELLTWLTHFVEERIEEGRRWDIREGILSLGGEIFKERNKDSIASLRTRAELQELISQATARSQAATKQLIAQAQALVTQIEAAGASMADFPQKSRGLAGWIYKMAGGSLAPYGSYVAAALREDDAWGKVGSLSQALRPTLQPLLMALCRAFDAEVRHLNTTQLLRETYRSFALLGDLYKEVQLLCEKQQLMVLSETKYLLSEFITEND
ncbi:MAG: UvrD-helicase domain-containing protein, partial [Alistipes sp.]|nr:UvrD-helicase domain-containing protein [Alistipes sp.]